MLYAIAMGQIKIVVVASKSRRPWLGHKGAIACSNTAFYFCLAT